MFIPLWVIQGALIFAGGLACGRMSAGPPPGGMSSGRIGLTICVALVAPILAVLLQGMK